MAIDAVCGVVCGVVCVVCAPQETLCYELEDFLGSFFHTGVPTSSNGTAWPTFSSPQSSNETQLRVMTPQFELVEDFLADECDFWDGIGYPIP